MRVWHFVDFGHAYALLWLAAESAALCVGGFVMCAVWSAKLSLVGALDMLRDTSAACVVVDAGMQPCPSGD